MVDLEDKFHDKQFLLKEISLNEDWLEEVQEELENPDLMDVEREALLIEEEEFLNAIDELEARLQSL